MNAFRLDASADAQCFGLAALLLNESSSSFPSLVMKKKRKRKIVSSSMSRDLLEVRVVSRFCALSVLCNYFGFRYLVHVRAGYTCRNDGEIGRRKVGRSHVLPF